MKKIKSKVLRSKSGGFDKDEYIFYLLAKLGAFPFLTRSLSELDAKYAKVRIKPYLKEVCDAFKNEDRETLSRNFDQFEFEYYVLLCLGSYREMTKVLKISVAKLDRKYSKYLKAFK